MLRGIYNAASGMTLNMQVVDVLAHNLANANTSGYKRRQPVMKSFGDILVDLTGEPDRSHPVGTTGTGVHMDEIARIERMGPLRRTGNTFDVALATPGHYFVVQRQDGTRLFTRDGQFYRNDRGQIVTGAGEAVLGADLGPLSLRDDARDIKIQPDGTILANETELGRLLVVAPTRDQLRAYPAARLPLQQAEAVEVRQGYLESSNVEIVTEMVSLIEANRSFGFEQKIVSAHDQMLQKAANDLGRLQ
ncbi:MAG: flagellar hook-basal body protein [Candidatus Sericytochromatia bacterium]|nr:flagellar hook-basal body protein [Candidatus Tanganyikabacteria bacterium]